MPQWIGGPEFLIIVLVIVVLFGWKKLPDAARSLGRSMRIFKSEVTEMKQDATAPVRDTVPGQAVPPQAAGTPGPGTTGTPTETPTLTPDGEPAPTGQPHPIPSSDPSGHPRG
ncbi:MAG TPA: Sec-independent protein translocase subunit TatA [Dermatophilaceae bacterium]|nr:Sec-independent protein translocase subunit TatA [Dermatophilaceae bacterium]